MASTSNYEQDLNEASEASDWMYEQKTQKFYNYNAADHGWRAQQRDDWKRTFITTQKHTVDVIDHLMFAITQMTSITTIYHFLTELTLALQKLKCLVSDDEYKKIPSLDSVSLNLHSLVDIQHHIICLVFK